MQYALIKNGTVQNVIEADEEFAKSIAADWESVQSLAAHHDGGLLVGIGWVWVGGAFTPPEPTEAPAAVAAPRRVTVGAFKNRLSPEERKAIRALARADEDVEDYMDMLNSSSYVDLDDPRTRGGLQVMEAAGVLGPGRALVVLDAPIQEGERP